MKSYAALLYASVREIKYIWQTWLATGFYIWATFYWFYNKYDNNVFWIYEILFFFTSEMRMLIVCNLNCGMPSFCFFNSKIFLCFQSYCIFYLLCLFIFYLWIWNYVFAFHIRRKITFSVFFMRCIFVFSFYLFGLLSLLCVSVRLGPCYYFLICILLLFLCCFFDY